MRRSRAFASGLCVAALSFVAAASAGPMPAPPNLTAPAPHVGFSGGDGSSCAKAVVITGAKNEPEGIRAERWWVFTKNPGAMIESQSVKSEGGKDLETITLVDSNGRHTTVCIDITSFYGKL